MEDTKDKKLQTSVSLKAFDISMYINTFKFLFYSVLAH